MPNVQPHQPQGSQQPMNPQYMQQQPGVGPYPGPGQQMPHQPMMPGPQMSHPPVMMMQAAPIMMQTMSTPYRSLQDVTQPVWCGRCQRQVQTVTTFEPGGFAQYVLFPLPPPPPLPFALLFHLYHCMFSPLTSNLFVSVPSPSFFIASLVSAAGFRMSSPACRTSFTLALLAKLGLPHSTVLGER